MIDVRARALFDFAKIVEAFDARRVSFVSITQQFNTTTSMGRLTLNVLLSFAQFEREVAGERIRDKIAASKKKGMWMGGLPSLGYDVQNRKLVVNEEEAGTVVHIFRRYVELRSVRVLQAALDVAGIRSKRRILADGTPFGGQKLSRGALYLMLQNRIYRGEITHRGNAYPGEHQPIIDEVLWEQVQAILAENRVERATGADAKQPSFLAGLIFDGVRRTTDAQPCHQEGDTLSILCVAVSYRWDSQGQVNRTAHRFEHSAPSTRASPRHGETGEKDISMVLVGAPL